MGQRFSRVVLGVLAVVVVSCADDANDGGAGAGASSGSTGITTDDDAGEARTTDGSDESPNGDSSGGGEVGLCNWTGNATVAEALPVFEVLQGSYMLALEECPVGADLAPFSPGNSYEVRVDADGTLRFDSDTFLTGTTEFGTQGGHTLTCSGDQIVHRVDSVIGIIEVVFEGTEMTAGLRDDMVAGPYVCTFVGA